MNLKNYNRHHKFLVAVDCIILGFDGTQLSVLLIKRGFTPEKGKWSLMGGFIEENEDADEAAGRVLYQLTGMHNIYMEQLYIFSDVNRDPAERVTSIAYYALVNIAECSEQCEIDYEARWFPLSKMPRLIFDHKKMVLKAKERLRQKITSQPIAFELLPQKFTLSQLKNLYAAIYEIPIDRSNFIKRMLSFGVLDKLDEKDKGASKRGAFYYEFDRRKYRKVQGHGIKFNFRILKTKKK